MQKKSRRWWWKRWGNIVFFNGQRSAMNISKSLAFFAQNIYETIRNVIWVGLFESVHFLLWKIWFNFFSSLHFPSYIFHFMPFTSTHHNVRCVSLLFFIWHCLLMLFQWPFLSLYFILSFHLRSIPFSPMLPFCCCHLTVAPLNNLKSPIYNNQWRTKKKTNYRSEIENVCWKNFPIEQRKNEKRATNKANVCLAVAWYGSRSMIIEWRRKIF